MAIQPADEENNVTQESPVRLTGHEVSRPGFKEAVSAARNGDALAWEELYLWLYPRLTSYACARLDPDRASEAVSETFARAVAGIGRFTWKDSGFEGWMFTILRNVIVDMHRRSGRVRRVGRHRSVAAFA